MCNNRTMEADTFKKQFGPQAENYTKYRTPYPQELFDFLFSLIPQNSTRILDVACGTGKSTEALLGAELKVYGCDHDVLMIEEAKKQSSLKALSIDYQVAEAEHLPYENGYFDVVTIGTAFHFFVNETAIAEIKRILKPGGLLFTFWTLTTKDVPVEDEIPFSIFQKYKLARVPVQLRDLDYISSFLAKSGLKNISTKRIPIKYNITVEERVGLYTTSGSYELLSEEDKIGFLDEIRKALTKNLGDRPYFTLEEEIQICYGFKV